MSIAKAPKTAIIGQENLVSEVNRIVTIFVNSECELRPHFILTGESGSGKSFTIKNIAERHEINFLEVNAAQLTKEGTSGNSLSKALAPLVQFGNIPSIVFVDEFDKLFISGNSNTDLAHETTNGVQNEFLKVLEDDTTQVFGDYGKYVSASTKNVLFIFAGAFNGESDITLDRLRAFGVKTEFLGRVGLVYNTKPLELEDLYKILENSELLTKYLTLFGDVRRGDVITIIKEHLKANFKNNTLGARAVNTLIQTYFIKGGKLTNEEVQKATFQKTMTLS